MGKTPLAEEEINIPILEYRILENELSTEQILKRIMGFFDALKRIEVASAEHGGLA